MTALSKDPELLVKVLLDEHTNDERLDSLLLSAAKAIERLIGAVEDETAQEQARGNIVP